MPIEEYLPEINQIKILNKDLSRSERDTPITMRHLLTHTSGFTYFFNSFYGFRYISRGLAEKLDEYDWGFNAPQRQIFEAGERWHYGRSLGIAGRVIEKVSGLDLDTYFKENIFEPHQL